MEVNDDALPPDELEEDFVEDAEEEEIQHDESLLQEEDEDNDVKVILFEGLVVDFDQWFEEIPLDEIILSSDEIPQPLSRDKESCGHQPPFFRSCIFWACMPIVMSIYI